MQAVEFQVVADDRVLRHAVAPDIAVVEYHAVFYRGARRARAHRG
jgi:hypothetical protein